MLKGGLQLQIGQKLAMSPQMQQTIRLLQYSTIELQNQIQEIMELNPLLEMESAPVVDKLDTQPDETDHSKQEAAEVIPEEFPVDAEWSDVYDNMPDFSRREQSDYNYLENQGSSELSLHEHLMQQLELMNLSPVDYLICSQLINNTRDNGYLDDSLEDILATLTDLELGPDIEIEMDEVVAMQHLVQNFDPVGCASANLQECLQAQLTQIKSADETVAHATLILQHHMDDLAKQDMKQLMKQTGLSENLITMAVTKIRSLNPKPGAQFGIKDVEYIAPEVYINRVENQWEASLNPDVSPDLKIHSSYSGLIKRGDQSKANQYLRERLQEARWFISSLNSRNDTILRVAQAITSRQQQYFDLGDIAMQPMKLQDIANDLNLHESTISRVTANKYMSTPYGLLEFKFFFSTQVSSDTAGNTSSTATKAQIKSLIDQENPQKPLSDNKITTMLLSERGVNVARRTVAKYREAMSIPPSHERKKIN